jgi:hypothetical protein
MSLKQDLNLNYLYIKQHYKYLTAESAQEICIYVRGEVLVPSAMLIC